ncbi:MAG: hypothetical protein EI684_17345 [Candidatus Viridilinea halotolerans]|uniref:CRISPR type III-associated protein domain-containing protein n=1 Tax=Candidatus Viridilinea halotolerans TaxID=2491704 RepID=A0A426TU57_9CHLR|nr:MAG: hypothetical protein EI684_17345 [Candidatus Viridilinea halotolerans]
MPQLIQRIDLHYRLHFESAFHFGTGMRSGLVHRTIARRNDGLPYVPGSTFKGLLRDHATQIARLLDLPARLPHADDEEDVGEFAPAGDVVAAIFGSRVRPGALSFDDATICADDEALLYVGSKARPRLILAPSSTRTRVGIARCLGTARRGQIFTSEYGLEALRFDGRIAGVLHGVPLLSDPTFSNELTLLLAALYSLERIGGNTSVGAGRVRCALLSLRLDGQSVPAATYHTLLDALVDLEVYEISREEAQGR